MVFYSTVLFVKDIEVSKKFFIRYLNFSVEHDFGKNAIMSNGLSLWEINPEHLINKQLETTSKSNRFELYFETDNLEEISHKLKTAGVKFLHSIMEESWGQRTIRFFDPDNHLVEIGEPMDVFINNMHKNGLTPAQISAKSGIPIEKVVGLIWK
jgi:catechol 2,3-dioxygenase-like lactoylglutathione lyase family enzyme